VVLGEAGDVLRLLEQDGVLGHLTAREAQPPKGPQDVIGIEIDAAQRWVFGAPVHVATNNTHADAEFREPGLGQQPGIVGILDDRLNVARSVGPGLEVMGPFADAPAIVAALNDEVHLFPFVLAYVRRP
jgi:hypothetical protein